MINQILHSKRTHSDTRVCAKVSYKVRLKKFQYVVFSKCIFLIWDFAVINQILHLKRTHSDTRVYAQVSNKMRLKNVSVSRFLKMHFLKCGILL